MGQRPKKMRPSPRVLQTLAGSGPRSRVATSDRDMSYAINWTTPVSKQGGAVASWLMRSTPDRVVRVRVLAGDIVLCSWARHFTLTVPLFTQVNKWVPAKCWG